MWEMRNKEPRNKELERQGSPPKCKTQNIKCKSDGSFKRRPFSIVGLFQNSKLQTIVVRQNYNYDIRKEAF